VGVLGQSAVGDKRVYRLADLPARPAPKLRETGDVLDALDAAREQHSEQIVGADVAQTQPGGAFAGASAKVIHTRRPHRRKL
jgi:hypothetical protein